MTRRVVVVAGSPVDYDSYTVVAAGGSRLQQLMDEGGIQVTVLSAGPDPVVEGADRQVDVGRRAESPVDRVLVAFGARGLYRRLARFPLGRLLNSLGPVDPGRVMWRAVRRDADAREALTGADIVLAADPAGIKTAWTAARRGWTAEAFYDRGAPAARRRS